MLLTPGLSLKSGFRALTRGGARAKRLLEFESCSYGLE